MRSAFTPDLGHRTRNILRACCATSSRGRWWSSARASAKSYRPVPRGAAVSHCVFEHVYFARPDSVVFGRNSVA